MRVAVDDATIDVAMDGKGEAIVLIHGFPMTRDIWDRQAEKLAQQMLAIRPDLRGMGRSSVPDGPYLMEVLAADIAGVLDAAGIERAAIVGHSLGGYVAMAFCRMYTERVTRLALVCSRLAADSPETARSREELADRLEREDRIDPAVDAYVPRLFAPATLEERAPVVTRAREIAAQNSARGAAAMLRGMAQRVDSNDIAEDLDLPVLIVAGAADQVNAVAEAEAMRRAFPRASLEILRRSGHLPMMEQPDELADLLLRFATVR